MSSFTFIDRDVLIDGVSTAEVASTLQAAGLAERRIGEILGYWYVGATGRTKPADVDLSSLVHREDPACEVTYERQFAHEDWFDGEDRVQAAATPEELGFNARFHAIENDLDAIAAQLAGLGACAAGLRGDLVAVVRALESRLNVMAHQIYELGADVRPVKPGGGGLGVLGTVKIGDKEAYITNYGNDFRLVEFEGSTIGTGGRQVVTEPPRVFVPGTVRPVDVVEIVAGLEDVLSTPVLRDLVGRGTTVADLRTVGDAVTLPGGISLASVIAGMPAGTRLEGVDGALETITAHVAASLPAETAEAATAEVLTDDTLRTGSADAVGAASGGGIGLSATTLTVLGAAGLDVTIGGLAGASTRMLAGELSEQGLEVSTDVLRGAVARARLATALRRL